MVIRHRQTQRGRTSDLDFWWKGERYRPCLGYDLDPAEEVIAAGKMVERIKAGEFQGVSKRLPGPGTCLADFKPHYLAELKERKVVDLVRPGQVLDKYLIPHFSCPMHEITYKDGQAYIATRREAHAADGTIAREWTILLSLLNFAVEVGELPANPVRGVTPPQSGVRNRMPTPAELDRIAAKATERLKRAATVAMNGGLREEKIWAIRPSWIVLKQDGPWLELPPPRSKRKGNPTRLPLNRFAYASLTADTLPNKDARVFSEWADKGALSKAWARAAADTAVDDLHFHDLRRWFASTLEDLGGEEDEEAVGREVVKYLLGHSPSGPLEQHYLVRSKGWEKKLRRAVDQLADRYEAFLRTSNDTAKS